MKFTSHKTKRVCMLTLVFHLLLIFQLLLLITKINPRSKITTPIKEWIKITGETVCETIVSYVKSIIYGTDKTTSKYPNADIISCLFNFPLLNFPALNMMNPVMIRIKAIFCRLKEINMDS